MSFQAKKLTLTPKDQGKSITIHLDFDGTQGPLEIHLSAAVAVNLLRGLQALQDEYHWPTPIKGFSRKESD